MDVTESRVTARALRAANERLQLATTTARIGIWGARPGSGDMLWDERQRVIYGVDARWRPDFERCSHWVHPADRERLRQTFLAPNAKRQHRIPRGAARRRECARWSATSARERPPRARRRACLAPNLDVTEVRAAQRERDALVERMQIISETVGVGVWDWDPDSNTSVWNDACTKLFGHTVSRSHRARGSTCCIRTTLPAPNRRLQAALGDGASFDIEFRVVLGRR